MASAWTKTKFVGVRYREREGKKNGIRLDKYFALNYKVAGKVINEAVGWESEGWSAEKAFKLLAIIRENIKTGAGPQTLKEMREENERQEAAAARSREAAAKAEITFSEFWDKEYLPSQTGKTARTRETEDGYYRKWIAPTLGDIPLTRIDAAKLDALKTRLVQDGKSPGTIQKVLGLVRQVWNHAMARDVLQTPCPVSRVKIPRRDAARQRFLTQEEARKLLQALRVRSQGVHDEALLALLCGLRAGEIFNLTVADCDFSAKTIFLRDTKSGKNRFAYMTAETENMLTVRVQGKGQQDLIFPAEGGKVRQWVSQTFDRVVTELGFNEGIADARQRVVFHTLRHTFASWLVQRGTPLYEVAKLMGHSTIRMTERYSHLAPDTVRRAAMNLEGILEQEPGKVISFKRGA